MGREFMQMPCGVSRFVVVLLASISLKDAYDLSVHNVVAVYKSSTDVVVGRSHFFHGADDCFLHSCCVQRHGQEDVDDLWFIRHGGMMLLNAPQLYMTHSTLKHMVKRAISTQAVIPPQEIQILPPDF